MRNISRSILWSAVVLSFTLLMSPAVQAVPASLSFTSYSGPTAQYTYLNEEPYDEIYAVMNGVEMSDISQGEVLVVSDINSEGTWKVFEKRGDFTISGNPSTIAFGTSDYNYLNNPTAFSFTPAPSTEVAAGIPFLLGTFSFTNGSWFVDPLGSSFEFTITASSSVAGLFDQQFKGTLLLYTNPNDNATKEERADWFYIKEKPGLGSVRVLEKADGSNVGSIQFWGEFGSLDLVGMRNPTGGAFLEPSTEPGISPVPEPTSIALLGLGLFGLGGLRRLFAGN